MLKLIYINQTPHPQLYITSNLHPGIIKQPAFSVAGKRKMLKIFLISSSVWLQICCYSSCSKFKMDERRWRKEGECLFISKFGWKSFVPNCYEARHHVCSKFLIQIYAKPKPNEFWSSKKTMKILARDYWL